MNVMVSVNCTAYNHERYIGDAIEGFLNQITLFDYEILIGEDCSTDGTRYIIENYMERFPGRIRLITSEANVGAGENTKRLVEASRGKYIALCEGDDYWTDPTKLQKQYDYMESNPQCSLCFHGASVFDMASNKITETIRPYRKSGISPIEDIIYGGGGFCATASLFFRKEAVVVLPEFFEHAHVGDYPLQMYLASEGYAYYIDEVMAVYRYGVEGSWNSQLNEEKDKVANHIRVNEADIWLLEEFNRFTEMKYADIIEKAVRKREFQILLLKNKIKDVKGTKYRGFYDQLTAMVKMKIHIRYYFPKYYLLMVGLKKSIRKIKRQGWEINQ